MGDVFRIGIVGTGFAPGAGELVQHQALAKVGYVLLVESRCIQRIERAAHIAGKHRAVGQGAAQRQIRSLAQQFQQLCHGILKEHTLHTGGANAADFFLVHQNAAGGTAHVLHIQHGLVGTVSADPVVLPVGQHHAPVKTGFPRAACRDHFQLCGEEIFLFHAKLLLQNCQHAFLHGFLACGLFVFFLHIAAHFDGLVAHDHIQGFPFYHRRRLLVHLVLGQMDQQVGHEEHRVFRFFAHGNFHHRAVLFHDDTVDRQGDRHPLVFFDSAVIMGIQQGKAAVFVQRVLLHIHAGGINVGP